MEKGRLNDSEWPSYGAKAEVAVAPAKPAATTALKTSAPAPVG